MLQKLLNGLHMLWLGGFLYLFLISGRDNLEFDTLSASITALELTLVIGGLASFGYFRYIAETKSGQTAKTVAEEIVERDLEPLVAREVRANLRAMRETGNEAVSDDEMDRLIRALDNEMGTDGQS